MMWKQIVEFHEKYGLEYPNHVCELDRETFQFRLNFMLEELTEYVGASKPEDTIDALVDLVYVAMGTAYLHGFNWSEHWNEVHQANMRKQRASDASESKRGSQLDVVKPEGWVGPNHSKYL